MPTTTRLGQKSKRGQALRSLLTKYHSILRIPLQQSGSKKPELDECLQVIRGDIASTTSSSVSMPWGKCRTDEQRDGASLWPMQDKGYA